MIHPNDQRSSNGFDRNSTIETMLQMLKDIKDNQSELKHHLTQLIRKVCDALPSAQQSPSDNERLDQIRSSSAQVDTREHLELQSAQEVTDDNPENTSSLVYPGAKPELIDVSL